MVAKHFICPPGGKITHYNVDLNSQSWKQHTYTRFFVYILYHFPKWLKKRIVEPKKQISTSWPTPGTSVWLAGTLGLPRNNSGVCHQWWQFSYSNLPPPSLPRPPLGWLQASFHDPPNTLPHLRPTPHPLHLPICPFALECWATHHLPADAAHWRRTLAVM